MKTLSLIVLTLFSLSSFADSVSLQTLIDEQNLVVISPVEINGLPVIVEDRGDLCHMLGFSRVIAYETADCGIRNEFAHLSNLGGAVEAEARVCNAYTKKLTSITCAGN